MADRCELLVGGTIFEGWEEVSVSRHLETLCGSFSLRLTDRWAGLSEALPVPPGAACEVRLGGQTVVTGYVDDCEPSFDANSHELTVAGRDRACDLVDCSAPHEPGEWTNISLDRLARILAAPFGVAVSVQTDVGKAFDKIAVEPGESAWETLERACRQRAVLCISDAAGGIVLTRTGSERAATALVEGQNILSARGRFTTKDRFSVYRVLGQRPGTDFDSGPEVAQPSAESKDASITRYRPLIIVGEQSLDTATGRERAQWEATIRAARGSSVQVTVQGWTQGDGSLWRPGLLAHVTSPYLRLDTELLIAGVRHTLSDGGTLSELDLRRPDAYQPGPEKKKEKDPLEGIAEENIRG
ncbi:phage baseplate assembly protein [Desulfocurvibacter africanus]|uniref:phage baseplate assembly protein n=1 Tax=Desulfocurvibacter africanus TaxID=873 RepID=UPI00040A7BE3|nr:hypothetical protein [Desulfocurvibacter africanus]